MQKGFALITVLAVLIMIALGTATVLQSMGSQVGMKSMSLEELKNQYLAEAGMQHALWKCRTNTSGCGGASPCCIAETVTLEGQRVAIRLPEAGKIKICVGTATECP